MTWETLQVEYYIHIKQSSDLSMVFEGHSVLSDSSYCIRRGEFA